MAVDARDAELTMIIGTEIMYFILGLMGVLNFRGKNVAPNHAVRLITRTKCIFMESLPPLCSVSDERRSSK